VDADISFIFHVILRPVKYGIKPRSWLINVDQKKEGTVDLVAIHPKIQFMAKNMACYEGE
jgi:hypothetical protein